MSTKTTGEAKRSVAKSMSRGTKHIGNMVWTAIHLDENGLSRAALTHALERQGLPGLIPEEASEQAAYGRAVRFVQRRTKASTVSIERDQRFGRAVLVRVNRGAGKEKTTHTFAKSWVENGVVKVDRSASMQVALTQEEHDEALRVEDELAIEFHAQRGMMDHAELGAWLVHALIDHANAIRVRDEGVLYFIPADRVEMFEKIRDALREAAPKCNAPAIRVMDDDESMSSVGSGVASALEREIASVLDSLKNITSDGARKNRTLSNRMSEISVIANRAFACDEVLGAQREALRDLLAKAHDQIEREMSIEEEVA